MFKFILQFFLFNFVTLLAFGQTQTEIQNFNESKTLLEEIKKKNTFRDGSLETKLGYFTLSGDPRTEAVKLNSTNQVPYLEFSGDYIFWRQLGLSASYQLAQNMLNEGTRNTTSNSQTFYKIGPYFKYILDETNVKNYFAFKLQYFNLSNDFILERTEAQFIKGYTGYLLGFERVLPATDAFDLKGAIEVMRTNDIESVSEPRFFEKKGTGLSFLVTAYYNLSRINRLGLGLGIYAFINEIENKEEFGKSTYNQNYRFIQLSYNYLF